MQPGSSSSVEAGLEVTRETTAEAVGSGDLPVLATPALLAVVERAAVRAAAPHVPPGHTSVGTAVELHHTAPTPVGGRVLARVWLERVEAGRLRFSFVVEDEAGEVARGTHERAVVERERFVARVEARRAGGPPEGKELA